MQHPADFPIHFCSNIVLKMSNRYISGKVLKMKHSKKLHINFRADYPLIIKV